MIRSIASQKMSHANPEKTLASQLPILVEKDENPFIDIDDADIDMAAPVFTSIDCDQKNDLLNRKKNRSYQILKEICYQNLFSIYF